MKWVGLLAAVALIAACFLPWVFIESKNLTITGISSSGTSFGKPGYFHFILSGLYLALHFTPRIWAKRLNLLVSVLNVGWSVRNYFLISACAGGDCPQKKIGLYIVLVSSFVMLLAALLPQMKLPEKTNS